MSSYLIRDARDEDRDRVVELTRRAYEEFADVMTPDAWKAFERAMSSVLDDSGDAQCIVADDNGRLVGSVFLFPAGAAAYGDERLDEAEFRLLAVSPNARHRGIGRALVEECIRRVRASGAHGLGLHSSRSFAAAIAMYDAMGFTRVPERDFQPEGAELVEGYRLAI